MRRKKSFSGILLLLCLLLLTGAWMSHEFYVSLTEIRYQGQSQSLEISMRVFPDDLDRALLEDSGIETQLATELEHPAADSLLKAYLLEHLKIEINQENVPLKYLGKETEGNAIWCYLESKAIPDPQDIQVQNTLLVYTIPEQVNIVQVYVGDWNKGLLLNKDKFRGKLKPG